MKLTPNLFNEVSQAGRNYGLISALFKERFCDEASKMAQKSQLAGAAFTASHDSLTVQYAGASICFHLVAVLPESGRMSGQVYVTRASHSLEGKKALLGGFSFSTSGATDIGFDYDDSEKYTLSEAAESVVLYFIKEALRAPVATGPDDPERCRVTP